MTIEKLQKEQLGKLLSHEERTVLDTASHKITASMTLREVPFPNMEGPAFLIEYQDRNGDTTKREIIIQWISSGRDRVRATAFCRLRNEVRTFNGKQIVSMIDVKTGGPIPDPVDHLRWLERNI